VRVQKALALLPDLEALLPLRALLVSIARPDERALWSSSGPYLTLGKRGVQPDELRRRMPEAFRRITAHLQALYRAYLEALESQQANDGSGAVVALLRAGQLEESVGRVAQARAWYEVALTVAETLQDRRPEVQLLGSLGQVALTLGQLPEGARHFQRALALAEAEFDQGGAIAACQGLGDTAVAQGQWGGAQAWYARGLRLAEASADHRSLARLERQLAVLTRKQGSLAAAGDHLRRAREAAETSGDPEEMGRVLATQGELDVELGRHDAAAAAYREALAWVQRAPRNPNLELTIRLHIAELQLGQGRVLEAEEELRRAEQLAIAANTTRGLVQIYTLMGKLRGTEQDETGFVFFEQAIELCNTLERSLATEAQVYLEYGLFRERLGQRDEARAYLERAREILTYLGEAVERGRVDAELEKLSA
jgi:tetratricopeptide (TPR) repeat protein